ncbi:NIPSNAP family protein [Nocardioides speluncae]|uniref:NIPSNAP family protein n=1 Tax=Nocardioides speluncae TaxID=2670337 RepID=UPI001F0BBFFD|nr:NIPSNAP family protein [Nocardioides speluncae]
MSSEDEWQVVELRQYTLEPQQRDVLVDIFDTHLVESQEELGMRVLGQFYDLDRPDRFVWLRGYRDMASRLAGLTAFYGHSAAWRTYGPAAAATMIDSDDVHLLRPTRPVSGLLPRLPVGATERSDARFVCSFGTAPGELLASFETEPAANDFPRLPVHEGVDVRVQLARSDAPSAPGLLRLAPTARSAIR